MASSDSVGVTFVNSVTGRGILNGVVNIQFGVYQFATTGDGKDIKVSEEMSPACRLRMDIACARQAHEALGDLLVLVDKADAERAAGTVGVVANGDASKQPSEKAKAH